MKRTRFWIALFLTGGIAAGAQGAEKLRVGLVLDKGGKDDKSFNTSAFEGATRASKEFNFTLKTIEATDDNAFEPILRSLAEKKFDLIVGIGFSQAEAIGKVAALHPDRRFAIVDAEVKGANVRSLLFEEHEGSFLVGAIAALKSKSGKIGFVGGMDIPLIRRFELAYQAGARQAVPKIQVVTNFVGVTSDAWNNPPKGKELAVSQFQNGVDVIFAAAGASNLGVFDAAEEAKKYAIGVDANQNWIKPGIILTSMMKRVDVGVYETCKDAAKGSFQAGVVRYGLGNQGVDIALDQYNKGLLPAELLNKVGQMKADILAGKIAVPDYYKKDAARKL